MARLISERPSPIWSMFVWELVEHNTEDELCKWNRNESAV